jgi:hypothetical protein
MTSIKFDKAFVITHDGVDYLMLSLPDRTNEVHARKFVSEMKHKTHIAELKVYRVNRSHSANAYAWVLIGKLAAALNVTTTEVYRQYIREIGDNFEILSIRDEAVGKMIKIWQSIGLGWQCDNLGADAANPGHQNLVLYYGSSTYDTKQMSNLISLIVQDCQGQGIETLTPEELAKLEQEWINEYGTS